VRAVILTRAGWWNDQVHGDAGARLVLDDETAADLVERLRSAVYDPFGQAELDGAPSPQTTFVGTEAATARLNALVEAQQRDDAFQAMVDLTEEMGLYDNPVTPQEIDSLVPDGAPVMKRPYGNASKAAWIDWAVHQGADAAEAAELTKNQLMARYGERL
jgi:hypothetical protein